jgi:hypothetical protein
MTYLTLAEVARWQAERIFADEDVLASYEIGALEVPRAVAEHLDVWLAQKRAYGDADVRLVGSDG